MAGRERQHARAADRPAVRWARRAGAGRVGWCLGERELARTGTARVIPPTGREP